MGEKTSKLRLLLFIYFDLSLLGRHFGLFHVRVFTNMKNLNSVLPYMGLDPEVIVSSLCQITNKSCQKPTIELAGRLGKNLTLAHWTLDISEVMLASNSLLI